MPSKKPSPSPDQRIARQLADIDRDIAEFTELETWCRVEAKRLSQEKLAQAAQHRNRITQLQQLKAEWAEKTAG